jgi:hypothetical protein
MSLRRSQRLQENITENNIELDNTNILSKKRKETDMVKQEMNDNEEINYYSYFFRKDIINNYETDLKNKITFLKKENPNLKTPMDYYKIYNLDNILEYCGTKTTYNLRSNPQNEEERKNQIEKLKYFLASKICSGIGEEYAMKAVQKAFEKKEFDIAVLATSQMEENIVIDEEDENISESQLTDYSQMTEYEDYSWLLKKDVKDSNVDKEYLPSNYRNLNKKLRNNNLFDYRTSSIKAFIIVELGECKLYPNAFTVNLICAKKGDISNPLDLNSGAFSGSGNILMGLYLYSILSHPELKNNMSNKYNISFPTGKAVLSQAPKKIKIEDKSKYTVMEETELDINQVIYKEPLIPVQHIAVLELAGAYMNPGGLCSYEKFGYYFDSMLYGEKCFYDYNNLPMIIYFNSDYDGNDSIKKSRVISIAAGDKKADFKKSNICDIRDKDKQTVLGYLKNYKIYTNDNIDINYFKEYYGVTSNMEQLLMYLDKGTKISIDSIINYLENPPLQPVNQIESMIKKIYENMNNKNGGKKKTRKIPIKMRKTRKIKNNKMKKSKKNKMKK